MNEYHAVAESLRLAIEQLWSGRMEFVVPPADPEFDYDAEVQVIGEIVFSDGRICWARARGQQDTLGTFLWRLGRLTREQLVSVQKQYAEAKGQKRLGTLLEESGFMSRDVLRRALLLHTRSAADRLVNADGAKVRLYGREFGVEEPIAFGPEEVLPEGWGVDAAQEFFMVENTEVRSWGRRTDRNSALNALAVLSGYESCGIVSCEGDMVAAHTVGRQAELRVLAISVAAMFEASMRAAGGTALGGVDHVWLQCDRGVMSARWINRARSHFVFVVQTSAEEQIIAYQVIGKLLPTLNAWLAVELGVDASEDEDEYWNAPHYTELGKDIS